jgi:arabinogalactan endo-1,4-beta-galactosidase
MNIKIQILTSFLILISCNKKNLIVPKLNNEGSEFISAVDISSYPEISNLNPIFYDLGGNQKNF